LSIPASVEDIPGITTEITGEGGSAAPLNDAIIEADRAGYEHLKITPTGEHSANFHAPRKAGNGNQPGELRRRHPGRRMVLGDDDKQPNPGQLER